MMSMNEAIGRRIRAQREKLGLKQHDIANALQVSPQAVSKWERGENAPDISLLVPLAQLLGVSTDNLLGYHENQLDVFDATVYFAVVDGYAAKSQTLPAKAVATWANGFFFQLTEAVLRYDGISVKYMGDTFLGFFSGPNHQQRAVQAAFQAKSIVSEPLTIALHSGEIYLGTIGHPDYSHPDIMGDTVNLAFMTMEWASHHVADRITATTSVIGILEHHVETGTSHMIRLRGVEECVEIHELVGTGGLPRKS
jgi:class 3 adenylate cyclase